tara:strand:+ start:164 stop:457 length:294 start_codon:yes stop_codon:yes gene_type:complete
MRDKFVKFLEDYWHQDSDLLFNDIIDAVSTFKRVHGDSEFEQLIIEIYQLFCNRQFDCDPNGVPLYESSVQGAIQRDVTRAEAEMILKKYHRFVPLQ